jgi:hypothetical protein
MSDKDFLYKIEYSQRFKGSSAWIDDTATVLGPKKNADVAIEKLRSSAMRERFNDRPCAGVKIHSCAPISPVNIL